MFQEAETRLRKDLESSIDYIEKELEKEDVDKFLNEYALDIEIIKTLNDELTGFDILITSGGPTIRLVHNRNACKIIGVWGPAEITRYIDRDICSNILDYLSEILPSS
jgi:hypothetical protein